jgi:diguanylate cyclase (GGDEF)-like protein
MNYCDNITIITFGGLVKSMRKRILIADDSNFYSRIIEMILMPENYEVIRAKHGNECLKMVAEARPDLLLLDVVLPDISGFDVCRTLRADETNNLMPIIILTSQDHLDDRIIGLELGADDYIVKPFDKRELLCRVSNTLSRIDRNRDANPLTGLPGNMEIQREIKAKIDRNIPFAAIYADLDNFKAYNDVYGFSYGDQAIKMTADILYNKLREYGNRSDFLGHIGGDDFILITTPDCVDHICNSIIAEFDNRIREKYNVEDLKRGLIFTYNRLGAIVEFPIMTISLAVITNEFRNFYTYLQVSEIAAELKKKAKTITGSSFIKDRRKA